MNAVTPVPLTTPDGVERKLRCTPGALKRIKDKFGSSSFIEVSQREGDWALFVIAYYMMYDEQGRPPEDLSMEQLLEAAPSEAAEETMAAIISAASQGRKSKNEVEALIKAAMAASIGSTSTPSQVSASDLNGKSSGTESPLPSLTDSSSSGSGEKNLPITEAE
ncbi:MAG: hypothetical protein A2Z18_02570 [Armatimonadetes bacterium RBG_16_58_9]|nr:MAG: hypothetical protein A2Z18_02570 [Armatimonadetes bacterium RBG_16_58_9]